MTEQETRFYKEGKSAFEDGLSILCGDYVDCPRPDHPHMRQAWRDGWLDALADRVRR